MAHREPVGVGLIRNGDSAMTIDTSGLSEEQKATSQFQSAYADMMCQLNASGFILALCAHEAAHLIYYEMMGKIRYEPLPPRLEYDERKGDFVGHLAAVRLIEIPNCEPGKWREWLTMIAYADVAGGVVGRKLSPQSGGGDDGDKEIFKRKCAGTCFSFWRHLDRHRGSLDESTESSGKTTRGAPADYGIDSESCGRTPASIWLIGE